MLKGFREFVFRGNVFELAVAVVVGTAFTAVVTSIVTNLINPIIAAIGGAQRRTAWRSRWCRATRGRSCTSTR